MGQLQDALNRTEEEETYAMPPNGIEKSASTCSLYSEKQSYKTGISELPPASETLKMNWRKVRNGRQYVIWTWENRAAISEQNEVSWDLRSGDQRRGQIKNQNTRESESRRKFCLVFESLSTLFGRRLGTSFSLSNCGWGNHWQKKLRG